MALRISSHDAAGAFLDHAEAWLREREDVHNLILSLAYARRANPAKDGGDALYATVEEGGRVAGCFMRTPPHKLLVTELPSAAAPAVAAATAERYGSILAVLGPEPAAEEVARAWTSRRGGTVRPGMAQRLHRLERVIPPPEVEGELRPARAAEVDMAVAWGRGFAEDAGTRFATARETVEGWIRRGELFVWEMDGAPRSIAVAGGRTPRGVRVGYVYTPPEERRRGFATALVAALSQRMLDEGYDFCVLYTDLANPTSNAIYRRVGYEPLVDVRDFDIRTGEGGG